MHLDRCVDPTARNQRKTRMTFNDVYNTAITIVYAMQFTSHLVPHEEITVVGSGGNIFILGANEVH